MLAPHVASLRAQVWLVTRLVFRVHAVQRMFERQLSVEDVRQALASAESIDEYPNDRPYPSRLVLAWCESRPLHVVVADNAVDDELVVITVNEPDAALWSDDLRRRRT